MGNIFIVSFRQILRNRYTAVFAVLSLLAILFVLYIRFEPAATTHSGHSSHIVKGIAIEKSLPKSSILIGLIYNFFSCFIILLSAALMGSQAIAGEAENETLVLILCRPIRRVYIYAGKFLALTSVLLLISLPSFMLSFAVLYCDDFSVLLLIKGTSALILSVISYSSVFLFMGIFRWGLYLSLGYALIWEMIASHLHANMKFLSIGFYVRSFADTMIDSYGKGYTTAARAALALFIVVFFSIVLGIVFFRRREFYSFSGQV